MLKATVSGSFRRHMVAVHEAVAELNGIGVTVLSPADPRIVDQVEEFVFVASDKVRSIRMVEDRHLESIRASHFLWLVAPDGYVGQSASLELGYAIAHDVPIFCQQMPNDCTLQRYVQVVPAIRTAVAFACALRPNPPQETFLLDPVRAIGEAHGRLESIAEQLTKSSSMLYDAEGDLVLHQRRELATLILPPAARAPQTPVV